LHYFNYKQPDLNWENQSFVKKSILWCVGG
jgi:glycosidase